jgi:hypothetical protein
VIERCCYCGLTIRDENLGVRVAKPHYHWTTDVPGFPADRYEPTVCAEHIGGHVDWAEFQVARELTKPEYLTAFGNATLPSKHRAFAEGLLLLVDATNRARLRRTEPHI